MIKIIFTLPSSDISGTEKSLLLILDHLKDKISPVIIIPKKGPIQNEFAKRDLKYYVVKRKTRFSLLYLIRLFLIYNKSKARILHHHSSRIDAIPAKFLSMKVIERNNMSRDRDGLFLNKFSLFDRLSSYLIDKIICVSYDLRNDLIQRGFKKNKLVVIYNGVEIDKYFELKGYQRNNHLFTIGMIGRLHPQKGHIDLFNALKIVSEQGYKFKVLVVGEGNLKSSLKSYVRNLELEKNIYFIGFQNELNKIYNLCDLVVVPSRWEPLPNTILEAMSAGKAIIATAVGGIPEVIKHKETGILVYSNHPRDISEAIISLMNDASLRNNIGANAKKYVRSNFTIRKMMMKTFKVYSSLLESPKNKKN